MKTKNTRYNISDERGRLLAYVYNVANPVNLDPFRKMGEELAAADVADMSIKEGQHRTEIRYTMRRPIA